MQVNKKEDWFLDKQNNCGIKMLCEKTNCELKHFNAHDRNIQRGLAAKKPHTTPAAGQ